MNSAPRARAHYVIKSPFDGPFDVPVLFSNAKTMYGGKRVRAGDRIYVFDSENEGGRGLVARGEVTQASATPKLAGLDRQTPRVNLTVTGLDRVAIPLGRSQLREFKNWNDGRPETELNFKLYRQATNKLVGISEDTASFLDTFF